MGGTQSQDLICKWVCTPDEIRVAREALKSGAVQGGVEFDAIKYEGELEQIRDNYDDAESVKANTALVDACVNAFVKVLRLSGAPAKSASLDARINWLKSKLPDVRKKTTIRADKRQQINLCVSLAKEINSQMGKQVINTNTDPELMCVGIMDLVTSLSMGSHRHFMGVARSVDTELNNLQKLKEMLESAFNRLYNTVVEDCGSGTASARAHGIQSLHQALMAELNQRIRILANLTSTTIHPVSNDLAKVLTDTEAFSGIMKSLNAQIGTAAAGARLSEFLNVTLATGVIAHKVNAALKTIGMSMSEYKNASTVADLEVRADKLMRAQGDNITRQYVGQFHEALNILKRNHGRHKAVVEYMQKYKVGGSTNGGCGTACASGGVEVSLPDMNDSGSMSVGGSTTVGGRVNLKQKLAKQTRTKTAIVEGFRNKSRVYFDRILKATMIMAKQIGATIPLDYNLDRFISIFKEMETVKSEGLDYALTGYFKHAGAVAARNKFIGLLKSTLDAIQPLTNGKGGNYFSSIRDNLNALLQLVEFYSKQFNVYEEPEVQSVFGRGEVADSTRGGVDINLPDMGDEGVAVEGGGEFEAFVTMKNAKSVLEHYYNVAKMKANLAVVAAEAKEINKDYEAMLGEATGHRISGYEEEFGKDVRKHRGEGDMKESKEAKAMGKIKDFVGMSRDFAISGDPDSNVHNWMPDYILQFKKIQLDGKRALYKSLQAVDLYLQHFTDSVAAHPDNIREISKVLSSAETINKWFDKSSGDYLASVFEAFPVHIMDNGNQSFNDLGPDLSASIKKLSAGKHYYEDLADVSPDGYRAGKAGNPFLAISPKKATQLHKFIRKVYEKTYALKNFISLFAYLGDSFGSKSVSSQVFWSPDEIYNGFITYLCASALSMRWEESLDYDTLDANKGMDAFTCDNTLVTENAQLNVISFGPYQTYIATPARNEAKLADTAAGIADDDTKRRALHFMRRNYGVVMSPVGDKYGYGGVVKTETKVDPSEIAQSKWANQFTDDNAMFAHAIKAMTAKIFTVAGMYNIMNYKTAAVPVLSTTRLILGGNDLYQTPTIIDDAVELYIRLPLLAEFYKETMGFRAVQGMGGAGASSWRIAMVPEVDTIWSGFVRAVFDYPIRSAAAYTDNQSRTVINEINGVYQRYKGKYAGGDLVVKIMNDFVAEVNRRYGVVSLGEMNDYIKEEDNLRRQISLGNSDDLDDFDILNEGVRGVGTAPSDIYSKTGRTTRPDYTIDSWHSKIVCEFRDRIDGKVRNTVAKYDTASESIGALSNQFRNQVRLTYESLKAAKSNDEKFKVVTRTIQGLDYVSKKGEEAMLLFHELVAAPLAVLTRITDMLNKFKHVVATCDVKSVYDALVAGLRDNANNLSAVVTTYEDAKISKHLPPHLEGMEKDLAKRLTHGVNDTSKYKHTTHHIETVNTCKADELLTCRDSDGARSMSALLSINWPNAYKTLIDVLFTVSADLDGLVELKVSGPNMILDTSKLQQYIQDVMVGVRTGLDKLRGSVDADTVRRYEGDFKTAGTVNWVQEELISNLFGNRKPLNMAKCSEIVTNAFKLFTKEWSHTPKYDTADGKVVASDGKYKIPLEWTVSELTHYCPYTMTSSSDSTYSNNQHRTDSRGVPDTAGDKITGSFMSNPQINTVSLTTDLLADLYSRPGVGGASSRTEESIYTHRWNIYLDESNPDAGLRGDDQFGQGKIDLAQLDDLTNAAHIHATNTDRGMGLMMKFNELLNKYVNQFVDIGTNKVYGNVLSGFANGSHANDIMSGNCWPDIINTRRLNLAKDCYNAFVGAAASGEVKAVDDWYKGLSAEMQTEFDAMSDAIQHAWDNLDDSNDFSSGADNTNAKRYFTNIGEGKSANASNTANITGAGNMGDLKNTDFRMDDLKTANSKYKPVMKMHIYLLWLTHHGPASNNAIIPFGDPEGIIFASIGKKIRTLFTENASNTAMKKWIVDNISDVPQHMKENYKANMPLFIKWFRMIAKKAHLIKQTVTMGVNVARTKPVGPTTVGMGLEIMQTLAAAISSSPKPETDDDALVTFSRCRDSFGSMLTYKMSYKKVLDPVKAKSYYTSMCDSIIAGCESLVGCCKKVLGELNDAPKYFELSEGSISSYQNINTTLPLMPFSTAIAQLTKETIPIEGTASGQTMMSTAGNGGVYRDWRIGYPFYNIQNPIFELNYGTRLVLNNPDARPVLDHFPGMKDIVDRYNAVAISSKKIDDAVFASVLTRLAYLSRYLLDTKIIGSRLANSIYDMREHVSNITKFVAQHPMQLTDAIGLTKSSDKHQSITVITNAVGATGDHAVIDREDLAVLNLIDMNIMPINVHQLRKEIPFANIYNYSCTLQSNLRDLLVIGRDQRDAMADTHDLMYQLCIDPYGHVPLKDFKGMSVLFNLVTGASSIDKTNVPKYVADELWNKVLLQEIHAGGRYTDRTVRDNRFNITNVLNKVYDVMDSKVWDLPSTTTEVTDWLTDATANGPTLATATMSAIKLSIGTVPWDTDLEELISHRLESNDVDPANSNWTNVSPGNIWDTQTTSIVDIPNIGRFPKDTTFKHIVRLLAMKHTGNEEDAKGRLSGITETSTSYISFPSADGKMWKSINITDTVKSYWSNLGYLRFNTKMVRDMLFFANMQRLLRIKMSQELNKAVYPVLTSTAILDKSNTEYDYTTHAGLNLD